MIVIDASVVVKIVLDEPDSDRASAFLRGAVRELCGPDLLTVEVCRAWVAAANARRIERRRALAAIEYWLRRVDGGAVPIHAVDAGLTMTGARLALELGHPLSDCIYLALADRLGCPVVTADARFCDRVADPTRVQLLAELV